MEVSFLVFCSLKLRLMCVCVSASGIPMVDTQKRIGDFYLNKDAPEDISRAIGWYTLAGCSEAELYAMHAKIGSIRLSRPTVDQWIESVKCFQLARKSQVRLC